MSEELLYTASEEQADPEISEIIESELNIEATDVEILEEAEEIIEVELPEDIEIEVDEAIGWVGGDSERHYSLLGRDEHDQHPITAISGLRDELNEIERLKSVYSDGANVANYYEWSDGAHDEYGYFVSLIPDTLMVKVCDGSDILGVSVDRAGFIGGQNQKAPRDNRYCLVVTSGLVGVRCEYDVQVGDCVVSNKRGIAEKVYNTYGYEVMALKNEEGITFALIDLKVQIRKIRALSGAVDTLNKRIEKAEKDIISAINVSQQAYNKVSDTDRIAEEVLDRVNEVIIKVDANTEITNKVEQSVEESNRVAVEARTIADLAVTSAESIRAEAEKTANETLANVNELVKNLEPVTSWTYIDPITGERFKGAEYLVTYINNGVATKEEIYTLETLTEENKSLVEKSVEGFQTIISSVDKYSVGEYSQSYGLSRKQAEATLKIGMIYIPTKHVETDSHFEVYVGEQEKYEFTPGGYYEWHINDQGQYGWVEYTNSVAFGMNEPTHTNYLRYWYIDSDQAPDGYEPYTLYSWINEEWIKVNVLFGNANNRIASVIRQTTNEINAEVINARGSAATLNSRIDEESAKVALLTEWQGLIGSSMSAIELTANDIGSSIAQIVQGVGTDGQVTAASIVTAINNQTGDSIIKLSANVIDIDADSISLKGKTINIAADDVLGITSKNFSVDTDGKIKATSGEFTGDIKGGTININDCFKVDEHGNVTLKGNITWGNNYPSTTVTDSNVADILVNGDTCGIFHMDNGKLAISANYIGTGTLYFRNEQTHYISLDGSEDQYIKLPGLSVKGNAIELGNTGGGNGNFAGIRIEDGASNIRMIGSTEWSGKSGLGYWYVTQIYESTIKTFDLLIHYNGATGDGINVYDEIMDLKSRVRNLENSGSSSGGNTGGNTGGDSGGTDPDTPIEPDEPDVPVEPTCSHSSTTDREENVVAATCIAEGSYDLVTYCDECGEETGRQDKVIDTLPHTYQWVAGQTFSCGSKQQVYKCVNGCNNVTDTRIIMNGKNCYKGVDGTTCAICGRPM